MRKPSRHNPKALCGLRALIAALVLAGMMGSCSDKGVHMPKHRKRRNCDCPTFAYSVPSPAPTSETAADGTIIY